METKKWQLGYVFSLAVVYGVALTYMDFLTFPPERDELHFWLTSLNFSKSWLPPLETLRDYNELSTPLPFLVFGWLERFFGGGIAVGRYLNLACSLVILLAIGMPGDKYPGPRFKSAAGLLLHPYFLGTALLLYTDMIAALLGLGGLCFYARRRFSLSGLCFILAISSRQYMVAFPAAILLSEFLPSASSSRSKYGVAAMILSIVSLVGWFTFFGGFGPEAEIARQQVDTVSWVVLHPEFGLYFLVCIGIYYVIPESILFQEWGWLRQAPGKWTIGILLGLTLLFFLFPPLQNYVFTPTMGYFDKAVRTFAGDIPRMAIYWVLAAITCLRFFRLNFSAVLVGLHFLMLMKAYGAWDKYALPVLVVLWFLKAWGIENVQRISRGSDPSALGG